MATDTRSDWGRIIIDLDPELQRQIEAAAAQRNLSVRDYMMIAVQDALVMEPDQEPGRQNATQEGRLSARSFARDWESPEDQVYDALS